MQCLTQEQVDPVGSVRVLRCCGRGMGCLGASFTKYTSEAPPPDKGAWSPPQMAEVSGVRATAMISVPQTTSLQ